LTLIPFVSKKVNFQNEITRGVTSVDILSELYNKGVSRRNFLTGAGAIGAATALAGCANDGTIYVNTGATSSGVTDVDILNFALNLEYLEANFFLYCATGSGLAAANMGTGAGTVTGGAQVTGLTSQQADFINELAYAEQQHVVFLRSQLGSAAVPMPNIDIVNSFNALATAAGIGSTFSPYTSWDNFLVGAFIFEDVGVTAYSGAAPLISPAGIASGYLTAAAGIQAVEAYHAGAIRTYLTAGAIAAGSASAFPALTYANQVSALRAQLGGGNETPLTLPTATTTAGVVTSTASSIVAASSTTAVGYSRTTDQVLHIVYGTGGGAGVKGGGFFPDGLNGAISVTQS
jgi:hypothetical protein